MRPMEGRDDKRRIEQLELQVEQLEADRATRDEFVAMVSHELRTPLTSIGGFSTTMLETWDSLTDGEKRRYLGIICAQSERLARLVAGLLTVARMDSGAFETRVEQVRVRDVIEAVGREVGEDRVAIECASGLMVLADRDHVAQILVNYVANALRYGADPVRIQAVEHDEWIHLRVIDAGEGIPDAFVPHLFERFSMNHGREMGGTGLGLNIVRVLAEAQGGRAWYEPSVPHGSCFAVSLRRFFA
jgi:signal transduction histidine kinase